MTSVLDVSVEHLFECALVHQAHGLIDRIVHRKQMRAEVGQLLEFFWRSTRGFAPEGQPSPHPFHAAPPSADGNAAPDAVTR